MCHFLIKWSLNEYYKNLTKASKMINCAKCINQPQMGNIKSADLSKIQKLFIKSSKINFEMPPRKSVQGKRSSSKKLSEDIIPIYQILSDKSIREPSLQILPQIESILKENPLALKMSFLGMLIRVCGLDEYAGDVDVQNTIQSLKQMLENAYERKKAETKPLILDTKNKFNKDFLKRLRQCIRSILSDDLNLLSNQQLQFNQSFLSWLQILTMSSFRSIRSASIQFARILIEQQIALYNYYHEAKQSKKAFNLSKTIAYFLQKVFSLRMIDIDETIRQVAFEVVEHVIGQLEGEILTDTFLSKIYAPLFTQSDTILSSAIRSLVLLTQKCRNIKPLITYLRQHFLKLVELSKSPFLTGTNTQALKLLEFLHHQEPQKKVLNRDFLVGVLESYASQNLMYGLHATVEVFYQSLYRTPEELELNSTVVLIEIMNLLSGTSNNYCLIMILISFFNSTKKISPQKIFNIDNMFTLLMSQNFHNYLSQKVNLTPKELDLLLTIIIQWNAHCRQQYKHLIKEKPTYEEILERYNSHILINCKQLFFEKMPDHADFSEKYIRLFANVNGEVLKFNQMQNYLNFVVQKVEKLFTQDLPHLKVYREIVNVLWNLSQTDKTQGHYSAKQLVSKLRLKALTEQDSQIPTSEIYKVSALLSHFCIGELTLSTPFLLNMIKTFSQSGSDPQRIEILKIFHFIHHYNFLELFTNNSEKHQETYKSCRQRILSLYIEALKFEGEPSSIKLCAFRGLCHMLKAISSSRFEDDPSTIANAYELTHEQMKSIYEYVTGQLFNSESFDYSSLDITKMLDKMSLETSEIKGEIIRLLFNLYENSYVFTCHSQSCKFIITLIKGEDELQREEFNKTSSTIPSLSLELTRTVSRLLNQLLQTYFRKQMKKQYVNKLFFWRLANEIFQQSRQDEKFTIILQKIVNVYFSKKWKLSPQEKQTQNNKLMVFILHGVEKILEKKEYIQLDIYENLLKRVYRRFEKQLLVRIRQYINEKTEGLQNGFLNSFRETLMTISKIQVKIPKEKQPKTPSQEDSDSENSQDENDPNNIDQSEEREIQMDMKKQEDSKKTNRKSKRKPVPQKRHPSRIMEVQGDENEQSDHETKPQVIKPSIATKRKIR